MLTKSALRDFPNQRMPLPAVDASVSITTCYTHLGQKLTADMHVEHELMSRIGQASESLRECAHLLANPAIPIPQRIVLASSLVHSRLLFAAELWHHLSPAQMVKLQAFMMKVNRIVLGKRNFADSQRTTDQQVNACAPLPQAHISIKVARLRHVAKVFTEAPACLRDVWSFWQSKQKAPGFIKSNKTVSGPSATAVFCRSCHRPPQILLRGKICG